MRPFFYPIIFLFIACPLLLHSQIRFTPELTEELSLTGLEIMQPLEARYKTIRLRKNRFLQCDYGISSRKEKLEIRYAIEPIEPESRANLIPHVKAFSMATHLATNNEEAVISQLSISPESLAEDFNADYGQVYVFQPKTAFSEKLYCQMLMLYKEGKGMVYVFFLFDDPNNAALDYRFQAVRFNS
jgi:hypothetical protein